MFSLTVLTYKTCKKPRFILINTHHMADMEIESLDNIDGTDNIILKSSRDGTAVAIPKTWAILSGVLKTALETDPSANEASVDTSGATLVQVVKFLEHHQVWGPLR
jgi:hypothetical protein